jgi:regulator of protease activity HflC (stomatin/prohibitin superfamily)
MWWIIGIVIVAIGLILFFPQFGIFGPFFTIVHEGTAKIVLRLGAYKKVLLCWKDHKVDEDGNIIDAPGKKSRGLHFVGIKRIDTLLIYKFRWKDIQLVEGEEKEQFHEVERDWVLVRPDVYLITLKKAETKPPERIPVDVQFAYTLRIVNPRKATLVAPPNWFENITVRLNSAHRKFVASYNLDDLLTLVKEKTEIRLDEIDKPFLDFIHTNWGIKVEAVQIRDIDLSPAYQEVIAIKRKKEMEAAGRAQEIFGTVIAAVAAATGKEKKDVQKEFKENPRAFYETHKTIIDNVMAKLSMEEKAYLRIETPGATGFEGALLRLIGAWKRMPRGEEITKRKKLRFH